MSDDAVSRETCEHRTVKLTGSGIGVIVNCERCGVRFLPDAHAEKAEALLLASEVDPDKQRLLAKRRGMYVTLDKRDYEELQAEREKAARLTELLTTQNVPPTVRVAAGWEGYRVMLLAALSTPTAERCQICGLTDKEHSDPSSEGLSGEKVVRHFFEPITPTTEVK